MSMAEQLSENSRQGFAAENPPCIGLETDLSQIMHWGCGHVYDETPVGIVVYVRNDPVNLVDPDGRFYMWKDWWGGGIGWADGPIIIRVEVTAPIESVTLMPVHTSGPVHDIDRNERGKYGYEGGGGPHRPSDPRFVDAFNKLTLDIEKGLKQSCLETLGKSNNDFISALKETSIYDGRNSLRTIGSVSGFSGPRPSVPGLAQTAWDNQQRMTIKKFFNNTPGIGAVYASGDKSIWLGKAFWDSRKNPELILGHESLHAVTGLSDKDLANRIGVTITDQNTTAIDGWFGDCISH